MICATPLYVTSDLLHQPAVLESALQRAPGPEEASVVRTGEGIPALLAQHAEWFTADLLAAHSPLSFLGVSLLASGCSLPSFLRRNCNLGRVCMHLVSGFVVCMSGCSVCVAVLARRRHAPAAVPLLRAPAAECRLFARPCMLVQQDSARAHARHAFFKRELCKAMLSNWCRRLSCLVVECLLRVT